MSALLSAEEPSLLKWDLPFGCLQVGELVCSIFDAYCFILFYHLSTGEIESLWIDIKETQEGFISRTLQSKASSAVEHNSYTRQLKAT